MRCLSTFLSSSCSRGLSCSTSPSFCCCCCCCRCCALTVPRVFCVVDRSADGRMTALKSAVGRAEKAKAAAVQKAAKVSEELEASQSTVRLLETKLEAGVAAEPAADPGQEPDELAKLECAAHSPNLDCDQCRRAKNTSALSAMVRRYWKKRQEIWLARVDAQQEEVRSCVMPSSFALRSRLVSTSRCQFTRCARFPLPLGRGGARGSVGRTRHRPRACRRAGRAGGCDGRADAGAGGAAAAAGRCTRPEGRAGERGWCS